MSLQFTHLHVAFLLLLLTNSPCFTQNKLNVNLVSHWDSDTILHGSTNVKFSDVWGYAADEKEYAFICSTEGVHFFEVRDTELRFVDFIKGTYVNTTITNRDVTTYKHYAYTGADHGTSNLQIIDLSTLPDSVSLVGSLDHQFGRIHNLFVDEENALLYVCRITPVVNGNPTAVIPMRVFSLADPLNPQLVYEGPNGISEVHDVWVQNNLAILNCGFDGIRVYDFSNPSNPLFKQNLNFYQQQGYNHQGAMTPNGEKYVFGDETPGKQLKLAILDDAHQLSIRNYFGTNHINGSIPHNIMCSDDFAYVAYYNEGFRIFDIRTNTVREIAHYDTYLEETAFKMNGAWGIYNRLPSKKLLVSDIQSGLYVFDFNPSIFEKNTQEILVYPSMLSRGETLTISLPQGTASSFKATLFDLSGKRITAYDFINQTYGELVPQVNHGIYFIEISYLDYLKTEIKERIKICVY